MPRQVQVFIPHAQVQGTVEMLEKHHAAHDTHVFPGADQTMVMFRTDDKRTDSVLAMLEDRGVGVDFGRIDITALASTKPRLKKVEGDKKGRQYRLDDRNSLEEIYDVVDSGNHLTFNYLAFLASAGLISAVGLATNSPAIVVAAMLISPLMGPIQAFTFGTAIGDRKLVTKGLRNEIIGAVLVFLVGLVWGACTAHKDEYWNTSEMLSRSTVDALLPGVLLAIPSGVGVALATVSGGIAALVGVAISAALLPPICLSGMYLSVAAVGSDILTTDDALSGSFYSGMLFIINAILIYITALLIFLMKKLEPGRRLHGARHSATSL